MKKLLLLFGLSGCLGVTTAAVALTSDGGLSMFKLQAAPTECAEGEHEGNHYLMHDSTTSATGNKEFWACCKCEHQYTSNPGGVWDNSDAMPSLVKGHIAFLPKKANYEIYWAEWDLSQSSAQCWVWAWGGQYGGGDWIQGSWGGTGNHDTLFTAYSDIEGCKCYRIKSDGTKTTDEGDSNVWNCSHDVTITEGTTRYSSSQKK